MPLTISASTAAPDTPRYIIGGTVTRYQTYVTTATVSSTDLIYLTNLKIPTGAHVTDVKVYADTPDGTMIFQLGYTGNATVFGSFTASATPQVFVKTTGLPHKVSVSDDAANRFVTVLLTGDGAPVSPTASTSITVEVKYTMDP